MRESSYPTGFVFTGHCRGAFFRPQKKKSTWITHLSRLKKLDCQMESKSKRVKFSSEIEVQFAADYNREMKSGVSWHVTYSIWVLKQKKKYMYLTTKEKLEICRQINAFKLCEMSVHPDSTINLHILRTFHFWVKCLFFLCFHFIE